MNSRWQEFYEKMKSDIATQGQSLVGVFRSASDPPDMVPFIYTIGNHQRGLPELLWIGGADEAYGAMLNMIGQLMRERARGFTLYGEAVHLGGTHPVWVRSVMNRPLAQDKYTIQTSRYYGTDAYAIAQVITPDKLGQFAWDEQCESPYRDIPLL